MYDYNSLTFWKRQNYIETIKISVISRDYGEEMRGGYVDHRTFLSSKISG